MLLNGCSKKDTVSPTSKKIHTFTYDGTAGQTLEYNSEGKISKITEFGDPVDGCNLTFTYSGNTVTKSRYYYVTGKTEIEASTLNPQRYISSTIRTDGTSTYEYDNSGYCVKETSTYKYGSQISTQTSTNAYINGNKTSCVETYNGSPNSTNT